MAIKGPNTNKMVQTLIVGLIFLYVITNVINFSAFGGDTVDWGNLITNPDSDLVFQVFRLLIVGMAVWLAWNVTIGATGSLSRKKLLTMIVMGIALYYIYNSVLVPMLGGDLQPIEFAAAQLKMAIVP